MTANTGKLTVMPEGEEMLELILSTESRVLSTNIKDFEQRAEQFLSGLTQKFETDDDFVAAKEEVKTLKEAEEKIRAAIKTATSGEVANLIETAETIAERFRTERLNREKLVKAKEAEIKAKVVNTAFEAISGVRYSYVSDISLAIEKTYPKAKLQERLNEAAKRRSTLATLTKAVNAEARAIIAELGQENARLTARQKLLPAEYEHLFKDWLELIAGDADLEPIVGVDGWIRIINREPQYDGMEFSFSEDYSACTCTIYRKDRSKPIIVTEFLQECLKPNSQPWKSHPKRMLRHKAMIQCARLAFGFTGIYDQDEAERIAENKEPINVTPKPVTIEAQAVELATEEQKQQIRQLLEITGTPFDKVAAFVGKNSLDEFPKDGAEIVIRKLNSTVQQQQRKQEEELGEAIEL